MIRVAALVAGVAMLASGCGGAGTAGSAAEVAPADVRAFVSLASTPFDAATKRALTLTEGGGRLQSIVDHAGWARAAGGRVELAQLMDGRLVAFARLKDTKALDAAGLAHARVRGWTLFAPVQATLDAARTKQHLADTPWYAPAARAAGRAGTTLIAPGWIALAAGGGTARRSSPGGGNDTQTAEVPSDAIAATAAQDGAALLRSPFAAGVQRVLGFPLDSLTSLAPHGGVLYVRPGAPIPLVTLLARDGSVAAARRAVRAIAPAAAPAVREGSFEHVGLGATDLYYGKAGRTLVFSDDPGVSTRGAEGTPTDVPDASSAWLFVDGPKARQAVQALARLHAAKPERALEGLDRLVEYTTHDHGIESNTVLITFR